MVIVIGTVMVLMTAAGIVMVMVAAYVPGARETGVAMMPIAAGDVLLEALVVSQAALEVMLKLVGAVAAMETVWVCGAESLG